MCVCVWPVKSTWKYSVFPKLFKQSDCVFIAMAASHVFGASHCSVVVRYNSESSFCTHSCIFLIVPQWNADHAGPIYTCGEDKELCWEVVVD